ncbi:or S-antigen, C-terminal domain-domain-containing protein [Absidia repens]|uniref:Or S-antigen, C-terminal domain-domain-containing protein n=1 Tax=Absidia repens TaxID=90262 RepID=A0A1X2IK60_9FUNG|nr:or S-antigen, C-terminal domain-domain-containing protein [Absidia repens]
MGKVCYQLTANLERSGGFLLHNTIQRKKPIRVVRTVQPSEFDLIQSLEIHNTWSEKMVYDISLPSKLYAHNATIPVSFSILPIANKLKVHSIMATLKECCTYHANGKRKTDSRIIKVSRQENPFSAAVIHHGDGRPSAPWSRVLEVQVPARSPMIFCDANSEMIRIRHKLKFVISIVNADGHWSELRATLPIVIMDSFGPTISAADAEASTLPTYDESWRSLPYDRQLWESLRANDHTGPGAGVAGGSSPSLVDSRQPVTISSYTRTMTLTSSMVPSSRPALEHSASSSSAMESDMETDETVTPQNEANEETWWHGVDLSRVPSYHSMADVDPTVPVCTQLPPAYDPIWQRCFGTTV